MNREKLLSALAAIAITTAIAFSAAILSTEFLEVYGSGIFMFSPFVCGLIAVWIYNRKGRKKLGESIFVSFLAGCISLLAFLFLGFEGLFCLAMAFPIVVPFFILGGLVGFYVSRAVGKRIHNDLIAMILVCFIPLLMGFESHDEKEPRIRTSITSVAIDAPIEEVWNEVIAFSKIDEPTELLFRLGIAYPIDAKIEGQGVGAVRYCNFSTGSFVEPITHWKPNEKLAFDVLEQPHPMKELSPFDHLHPPHLDWAVRSIRGQFIMNYDSEGKVLLEGTTWFFAKMEPEPYWSWLTESMIHMVHMRVLEHIQQQAESKAKQKIVTTARPGHSSNLYKLK
jgi:hypothetical protein